MADAPKPGTWRALEGRYWALLTVTLFVLLLSVWFIHVRAPEGWRRIAYAAIPVALALCLAANTAWCLQHLKSPLEPEGIRLVGRRLWIPLLAVDGLLVTTLIGVNPLGAELSTTQTLELTIRASDPQAAIWINGRLAGKSPLTLASKDVQKLLRPGALILSNLKQMSRDTRRGTFRNSSLIPPSTATSDFLYAVQANLPGFTGQGSIRIRVVDEQGWVARFGSMNESAERCLGQWTDHDSLYFSGFTAQP